LAGGRAGAVDPFSSWNDGATKKSITDFVAAGQFSPSAIRTVTNRLLEWTAAGDGARFTGLVDTLTRCANCLRPAIAYWQA
jgi:hypothetical protein